MNKNPVIFGFVLLLILVGSGVWFLSSLVEIERERNLHDWQLKLGLMADARVDAVGGWTKRQFGALQELSENGSLQLYMTQVAKRGSGNGRKSEPAQLAYLRNLVRDTAMRAGFQDKDRIQSNIKANVAFRADAGLVLLDQTGKIVVSTPGMSMPEKNILQVAASVLSTGKRTIQDIYLNETGKPVMGFVVPVFALQGLMEEGKVIGVLVGIKNVERELYPLVQSRGLATHTDETIIIRKDKDRVVYLSSLKSGESLLSSMAFDTPDLASTYAIDHPGGFKEKRDYSGRAVLVTSRELPGLPWVILQKIDVDEALKESDSHQQFLFTSFVMAMLVILAVLVAVWRHGSSLRERKISQDLLEKSRELESQTRLLNAINDNISDYIFLLDNEGRFIFSNKVLAEQFKLQDMDMRGKTLSSVFGPSVSDSLDAIGRQVLETGGAVTRAIDLEINNATRTYHSVFIPIPYNSSVNDTSNNAVLIALHDITLLQEAQRKYGGLMQQLVRALMSAIDLHAPFMANHSARTTEVALAIGKGMQLQDAEFETLEIAANISNLGKLFIPGELLTKTEELSAEDHKVLRQEAGNAIKILSGIKFDGPVLEIITQKNEYMDGSGYPEGRSGDTINQLARILSVANAFVAMISARAYRKGMPMEMALDQLLELSKTKYDRHVVAALFHVAENRADWSAWQTEA
ncbi:MAG: PAS domain-containing protein [Gammaproteobacteria bacterium]|nr:PAS domain-containing protein [Gammaproteobacteria bacterium]